MLSAAMARVSPFPTKGSRSMHQSPSMNAHPGVDRCISRPTVVFPAPMGPFKKITLFLFTASVP